MKCSWKEASTLILTALKRSPVQSDCNYELLTLERSAKSSFMPSGYVFPGGTTEPADSDKVWLDLFSSFRLDFSNSTKLVGEVPPIIANNTGAVPKLLSLKITALRETFEETGILLGVHKKALAGSQEWASHSIIKDLDSWRRKVQKDAREFFNMCQHFDCCPDVNSLHLWSNWLTPTSMGSKRFDTSFFIASLSEIPTATADKTEIEKLNWTTPNELMEFCKNKQVWLPPPQVYETARLLQFKDINGLKNFAQNRSSHGCERWMPVQIKTSDGMVSLLPGDESYNLIDYCTPTEPEQIKLTNEEFRNQAKVAHRMEFLEKIRTKIVARNYKPTNGHVLPVGEC